MSGSSCCDGTQQFRESRERPPRASIAVDRMIDRTRLLVYTDILVPQLPRCGASMSHVPLAIFKSEKAVSYKRSTRSTPSSKQARGNLRVKKKINDFDLFSRYQQSELDLVRCRHGTFDSVKRNRSADTVLVDSGRRYGRGGVSSEDKCHRNSDLDLVGTLPKRKPDARNSSGRSLGSNSSFSQPCVVNTTTANVVAHVDDDDDDLLMKMVHKPDCELLKHRQQFGKCPDLKLNKLASGEPQDQGYASERSPEDEHPPSLPGQPFPNVTPGKLSCITSVDNVSFEYFHTC